MTTATRILSLVLALSLAADGLVAQRRGTGGGGGRGTPSGRGSASSGTRRTTSGGGDRRSSSSGARRNTGSRGSQPSTGSTSSGARRDGKIGAVKGEAGTGRRTTGGTVADPGVIVTTCWGCGYWGGWGYPYPYPYPHPYPTSYPDEGGGSEGQGYLDYPFASSDTMVTFVRSHTRDGRSFGALSGQYFADQGSTTKAGRFALEGATGLLRGELEYSHYAEPLQTRVDRLHTFRGAVGLQPRMGRKAYVVLTGGLRGVVLDNGRSAFGPEGELGIQSFPQRHLGVNVTGRLAGIVWSGTNAMKPLREVNATGSLFINRVELQAGWHWLRIGDAPAFGGPMLGTRLWF